MVRVIQTEWIFIQYITWDTGGEFEVSEKVIKETFLPRKLFRKTKSLSPILGSLSMMTFKKAVLGLLNPVTPEKEKQLSSQRENAELI